MSDDEYGPPLPPGFSSGSSKKETETNRLDVIGPTLPPHLISKLKSNESDKETEKNTTVIGPVLPSHLISKALPETVDMFVPSNSQIENDVIGPKLPSNLSKVTDVSYERLTETGPSYQGDDDSDDDYVGPRPSEMARGNNNQMTAAEFESRARRMKDQMDGKDKSEGKALKREAWMMELPDCLGQNIGLQARTFKVRSGPDLSDRSSWTDTPADRERKLKEQNDKGSKKMKYEEQQQSRKDKKLAKEIEQYNKSKRAESLLDIHQKKLKSKKSAEKDQPKVRQPFDRERDLEVNKFDDAQRKSIIKQSQNLNSRFGHSKTSQFL